MNESGHKLCSGAGKTLGFLSPVYFHPWRSPGSGSWASLLWNRRAPMVLGDHSFQWTSRMRAGAVAAPGQCSDECGGAGRLRRSSERV